MTGDVPDRPSPDDNPFSALPMFGDLAKALAGQGPLNWDAARQFAHLAATDGAAEANVDPAQRIALERLAAIAAMQVGDVMQVDPPLGPGGPAITTVTPGMWAQRTLEAYRPLFTDLATSLGRRPTTDPAGDPTVAMLTGLSQMMAPSMMGMAIGSMVGRMAKRAFGRYDLPIPREGADLLLVPATIDAFAADWSVPADELRLWVLAQEQIGHVVFGLGTVRADLSSLVRRHAGAFRPDPDALVEQLATLDTDGDDDPMQAIQRAMSDPAIVLGAVESDEQRELKPHLDAAFGAVVGLVDYIADAVTVRLIGGEAISVAEAIRRRRIEHSPDDVYVQRLLGLQLTQAEVQRGKQFIAGVMDRLSGPEAEGRLVAMMARPNPLPTPSEFAAPGLWVARLEL